MSLPVKFSDIRGENVSLNRERNSATWKHVYSGGVLFSQLPLETEKPVKLTLRGTSIVHVGFYKGDPQNIEDVKELYLKKEIDLIAQLNIYNQKCSAYLKRNASSVTYKHAHIPYTKNIIPGTAIWIAIYIQFGDACVKMCSKTDSSQMMQFHSKHGTNIQFWDKTRMTAQLRTPNPAATSCIELNPTEDKAISVTLRMKPCSNEMKKYGLQLAASHSTSKLLSNFHETQPKCTAIQSFERKSGKCNTCDGELTIKVEHGGRFKYHHDTAGTGSAQVTDQYTQQGGIILILDMSQVRVDIIDAFEYEPRSGSDDEEDCSSMSSVNSTAVISTCLDRSLHSPTSIQNNVIILKNTLFDKSEDSLSQDKTESSADDESDISFKQPLNADAKPPPEPKDRDRLNAWVHETTMFQTPESQTGRKFIVPERTFFEISSEKIPAEARPTRKRTDVSCPTETIVQPKQIRLHDNLHLTEREMNSTSYQAQKDVRCASLQPEQTLLLLKKTNDPLSHVPATAFFVARPFSPEQSRIPSTEQSAGESHCFSPKNARLQLKRSKMGVRLTPPINSSTDDHINSGVVSPRHQHGGMIKHQLTYPDLSTVTDHSDLFRDDYNVVLKRKAASKHHLKDNIQQNYTKLVENLETVPLIDHLFEADILGREEYEKIRACKENFERNRILLLMLPKKPSISIHSRRLCEIQTLSIAYQCLKDTNDT